MKCTKTNIENGHDKLILFSENYFDFLKFIFNSIFLLKNIYANIQKDFF